MNWFDSSWMQSPNFKVAVYVLIAMLTAAYSVLANDSTWGPIVMTAMAGLTVLKAYTSDPNGGKDDSTGGK